jgi:hypothetical protein
MTQTPTIRDQVSLNHIVFQRKNIMRYLLILIAGALLASTADAQLRINLGFNLDRQPAWGPTGYDHVEYYYMPDMDVYFNVPQQRYYYNERGRWIGRSSLPPRYRGSNMYNSYKVVVNEPRAYENNRAHREQYSSFKGRHDQEVIRDSRDSKYFVNRYHPQHNSWMKQQRHDNGEHNGNGNKKDKNRNN